MRAMKSRVPAQLGELGGQSPHNPLPTIADLMVRNLSEPSSFRHFDGCSAIVGMVPQVGGSSHSYPKVWQLVFPWVLAVPHEGWQRDASSFLEQLFLDCSLLPRVSLAPQCQFVERGKLREGGIICGGRGNHPRRHLPSSSLPSEKQSKTHLPEDTHRRHKPSPSHLSPPKRLTNLRPLAILRRPPPPPPRIPPPHLPRERLAHRFHLSLVLPFTGSPPTAFPPPLWSRPHLGKPDLAILIWPNLLAESGQFSEFRPHLFRRDLLRPSPTWADLFFHIGQPLFRPGLSTKKSVFV